MEFIFLQRKPYKLFKKFDIESTGVETEESENQKL